MCIVISTVSSPVFLPASYTAVVPKVGSKDPWGSVAMFWALSRKNRIYHNFLRFFIFYNLNFRRFQYFFLFKLMALIISLNQVV